MAYAYIRRSSQPLQFWQPSSLATDRATQSIQPVKAGSAFVPRDLHKSSSASYAFFLLHALGQLKYGFDLNRHARWQLRKAHRAARVKAVAILAKYFVV